MSLPAWLTIYHPIMRSQSSQLINHLTRHLSIIKDTVHKPLIVWTPSFVLISGQTNGLPSRQKEFVNQYRLLSCASQTAKPRLSNGQTLWTPRQKNLNPSIATARSLPRQPTFRAWPMLLAQCRVCGTPWARTPSTAWSGDILGPKLPR